MVKILSYFRRTKLFLPERKWELIMSPQMLLLELAYFFEFGMELVNKSFHCIINIYWK